MDNLLYFNIKNKSKCKIKIKNSRCFSGVAVDMNHKINSPFFSILNERGVFHHFVNAIAKNAKEEAMSCISKFVVDKINLDEIYNLLGERKQYKPLIKFNKNDNSVISIAVGNNDEIVHVKMVEEADCYGNWKIVQIEKE